MTVEATQRKPRGQGASRRGEILDAAKRLFVTEGFEQATIRKIAAAVGVSSGALYLYFPDKDAILRGIAEDTFTALLAALQAARHGAGRPLPGQPLERLRACLRAYVAFGLAHGDEYRLTFLSKMMCQSTPGRPSEARQDIEAADRSFDLLVQDIAWLITEGVFRPLDPATAAEALWACVHGVTALLLDHQPALETAPDCLAETVIDIAVEGLRRKQNDH